MSMNPTRRLVAALCGSALILSGCGDSGVAAPPPTAIPAMAAATRAAAIHAPTAPPAGDVAAPTVPASPVAAAILKLEQATSLHFVYQYRSGDDKDLTSEGDLHTERSWTMVPEAAMQFTLSGAGDPQTDGAWVWLPPKGYHQMAGTWKELATADLLMPTMTLAAMGGQANTFDRLRSDPRLSFTPVGSDTIAGAPADHYSVHLGADAPAGTEPGTYDIWITTGGDVARIKLDSGLYQGTTTFSKIGAPVTIQAPK
ncbi:MAG TPA: hypothetical protein VM536_06395 [Chloroflexia bacterium]|nr:hypothetical protein [Chloroflexia bacterium]